MKKKLLFLFLLCATLQGAYAQYDVGIESIQSKNYVRTNVSFELSGIIHNYGTQAINSFDLTYKVGEKSETKSISGVDIQSGTSYTVELPEQKATQAGELPVELTVSNINGEQVDSNSDNDKMSKKISCIDQYFDRKILLEQFTGQGCPNCPRGEDLMKAGIAGVEDRVNWVAHHTYNGKDDFTVDQSTTYANFFRTDGVAPMCAIDRTATAYSAKGAVVFLPFDNNINRSLVDSCLEKPTFVNIKIEGKYDNDTRDLSLTISGEVLQNLPNAKLNVFLIENGIIARQSSAGLNYEHNHSLRDVLTPNYGEKLQVEDGRYSMKYTYTVPKKIALFDCVPYNMWIVAFVADDGKLNNRAYIVHNSEQVPLTEMGASISNETINDLAVYSQDGNIYIDGEYNEASIFTPSGELVKVVTGQNDIKQLSNGLYIIKITLGNKTIIKKVIVND